MAVNLYKANVYKIGWNFGWVRLLGGEIWEIQINEPLQPSSKIYKTFYKSLTIIISILTVIYPKETVFITVVYHYHTIPVSEDIIATVYFCPLQEEYHPESPNPKYLSEYPKYSIRSFFWKIRSLRHRIG